MTFREKQKVEALERMKMLGLMSNVIEDFKKSNKVYYSERQNKIFLATLYWVDNEQKFVDIIKSIEKKHNILVYHCQLTHTEVGDLLSCLYVSNDESNWEFEKKDLLQGSTYCYVANLQSSYDSDWGSIGIKPMMGGILRTA